MLPLATDLQIKKNSLDEFIILAKRVLDYTPNVLSGKEEKGNYYIYSSDIGNTKKFVRPINKLLFIPSSAGIDFHEIKFREIIEKIKIQVSINNEEEFIIDSFLYTLIQSVGMGLDLLVESNSSKKHVGNRFEELVRSVFNEIAIHNKKGVTKIPYETSEGTKFYSCENDLILSPSKEFTHVRSLDQTEIVVSVKTTSKDRMGKIFMDKILLEKFIGHPVKVLGIFLNDVQRKKDNDISFTLVSGLFMVYNRFLTELEGVYYLDPPPNALLSPYNRHIKPFSKLLSEDLHKILSS
ncbi:hypothetical protein [Sphingobacterium sp. UBA1498]|uniref:hypothetical protein n=1 Tax=Sphingobacterium sp. UBA1498 TaxID=1947481 RepID=UPI0025E52725|nr:hypothetical protein [Sphingobacterium sp. UBA1498]